MVFGLFKKPPVKTHPIQVSVGGKIAEFTARENKTLLESALQQNAPIPYSCQVGSCGECLCQVVEGEIEHLKELDYMLDQQQLDAGFTLACQTYARSAVKLQVAQPDRVATLESIRQAGPALYLVTLVTDGAFQARVGQYLPVRNAGGTERSYSIVHAEPRAHGTAIELHIGLKTGGEMSHWWQQQAAAAETHQTLTLGTPSGQYGPKQNSHLLATASGSGLGVTVALIRKHLREQPGRRATLLAFTRPGDGDYLGWLQDHYLDPLYGRIQRIEPSRSDFNSAPSRYLKQGLASLPPEDLPTEALICGSPALVDTTMAALQQLGLPRERISYDEFR